MTTDLSIPSFAAAYRLSRLRAVSGDPAGAARLFSRLLWHVEASEGGFIGLSDEALQAKCESTSASTTPSQPPPCTRRGHGP